MTGKHSLAADLEEMEASDPDVARAVADLNDTIERLARNIHQVYVTDRRIDCTLSCGGTPPHVADYRAEDRHGMNETPRTT